MFSDKTQYGLIIGGWDIHLRNGTNTTELFPNREDCNVPFPTHFVSILSGHPSLIQNDEQILLCGGTGNMQKCLAFQDGKWSNHSDLNEKRKFATAIAMPKGIYIFGGYGSSVTTWEWLPKGQSVWQSGRESIPDPGFELGCGVQVSEHELLLIGGKNTYQRILKFSTKTHEFEELSQTLKQERYCHSCIKFEDAIIVTGGHKSVPISMNDRNMRNNILASTELLIVEDLTSAKNTGMNMTIGRMGHHLGVVYCNDEATLLAIGGMGVPFSGGVKNFDTIEIWDHANKVWTLSRNFKLLEPRQNFGFLSVPRYLVCPHSQSVSLNEKEGRSNKFPIFRDYSHDRVPPEERSIATCL